MDFGVLTLQLKREKARAYRVVQGEVLEFAGTDQVDVVAALLLCQSQRACDDSFGIVHAAREPRSLLRAGVEGACAVCGGHDEFAPGQVNLHELCG